MRTPGCCSAKAALDNQAGNSTEMEAYLVISPRGCHPSLKIMKRSASSKTSPAGTCPWVLAAQGAGRRADSLIAIFAVFRHLILLCSDTCVSTPERHCHIRIAGPVIHHDASWDPGTGLFVTLAFIYGTS